MENIREAEDFINGHIGRVLKEADESEEQEKYLNFYKCSECDERWMKGGASKDNDICPLCGKETVSYNSKPIEDEIEEEVEVNTEVKESVMVSKSLDWMEENYLEEAIQEDEWLGPDLLNRIADLTDRNDHTGSVMALAQFLKAGKSIKILKAIKDLHNIYGHMPSQLIELRSFELAELLKQVGQKYGEDSVAKVKAQF